MQALADKIVEKGEQIYREKYQAKYERKHQGKFVAILIDSGRAFVAETAIEAAKAAERADPHGFHYLLRVGAAAAYQII